MISRLTICLALAATALAVAAPAATAAPSSALPPAAKTVAECVQKSGRLLVDIQIDRSGSLRTTDPEGRRVDGVGAALIGLARLAGKGRSGEEGPQVEVLLSNFAGSVLPANPAAHWQVVDDRSLDRLLQQAEGYGRRDNGRDTDYALALAAARSALDARAAAVAGGGPAPCKVIVFLSDGEFHIGNRSGSTSLPSTVPYAPGLNLDEPEVGPKAVEAGEHFLCRHGGLMDRMVGEGIVTFTVALSASPRFTPEDRAFLGALTTGAEAEARCGSQLSDATGDFTEVRDALDLFFAFSNLLGSAETGEPCQPGRCPNPNEFIAVPGLSGFVLSASAPLPGVELALTDPAGSTAVLSGGGPTQIDAAGATVHQHWIRSRSVEIQARFDPDSSDWRGPWRFLFFTPSSDETPVPAYALSLQSELQPEIVGSPELVRGSTATVPVELVDQGGTPVTGGRLAEAARLRAEVVDGTGASRPVDVTRSGPGRFDLAIDVPAAAPGGRWSIAAEVSYPTKPTPVESRSDSLALPSPRTPASTDLGGLIAITAGLLLLLAALALYVVYRRRRAAAKFTAPQLLRAFARDATVRPGRGVELTPEVGVLRYEDFERVRRAGRDARVTRFRYPPFEFRARPSWRLRGQPAGEVSARGGALLVGGPDGPRRGNEDNTKSQIPLEPAGSWLFAVESIGGDQTVRGRLLLLTDDDAPANLGQRTLDAARVALLAQSWEGFGSAEEPPAGKGADEGEEWTTPEPDEVDWESV